MLHFPSTTPGTRSFFEKGGGKLWWGRWGPLRFVLITTNRSTARRWVEENNFHVPGWWWPSSGVNPAPVWYMQGPPCSTGRFPARTRSLLTGDGWWPPGWRYYVWRSTQNRVMPMLCPSFVFIDLPTKNRTHKLIVVIVKSIRLWCTTNCACVCVCGCLWVVH